MHFIDPLFITEIALPEIIQLTATCLISGIVVGLIVGGILAIWLKPRRLRISGAVIGAVISQFTFGLYLQWSWFRGPIPPINYLLYGLSFFFGLILREGFSSTYASTHTAIALLGALPGAVIGSLILPRLERQKRGQYSLLSLGIAYLVLCSTLIAPAIAPIPHFARAKVEQFPFLGTLIGHTDEVTSLAFHPTGEWLISGGKDNAIRYWQPGTGNLHKTIRGDRRVDSLAVTSEGQFLISSGATGVKVRQLSTGKMVKSLETAGNNPVPSQVIVTQQGQVLSKGIGTGNGLDIGFVKVWQLTTGKRLQTIQHGPGDGYHGFEDMVVSPDGKILITGSNNTFGDDNIRLYRLSTGSRQGDLASGRFAVPAVRKLAITPDGKTLIVLEQEIWLWDMDTGKLLHRLPGQEIKTIAVSPNGRWLIGAGNALQIWELSTGNLMHDWDIQFLTKEESLINAIAISPDSKTLAMADENKIRMWALNTSL